MQHTNPKIKTAVELFEVMVSKEVELDELADELDNAIWELASYKLTDTTLMGHRDNTNGLYYIKLLRDLCRGKS